ncbi:hypothetical protein PILCRDRAFT_813392 [Piloderma croceum F 1598]|uniref:Uncharacterized protein n=1 Tax=Piloderma croceum (strain F 1598) TaxID=765440 RepID=A0A0C3GCL3_PILCF|nr:hypothetical protein PILCRDRAFT_813392 [Piloderma croceum F 1598]
MAGCPESSHGRPDDDGNSWSSRYGAISVPKPSERLLTAIYRRRHYPPSTRSCYSLPFPEDGYVMYGIIHFLTTSQAASRHLACVFLGKASLLRKAYLAGWWASCLRMRLTLLHRCFSSRTSREYPIFFFIVVMDRLTGSV